MDRCCEWDAARYAGCGCTQGHEDRRRRQAVDIATAKADGAYKSRPADTDLHMRVSELLADGKSIRKVAELLKCSTTTLQKVKQLNSLDAAHEEFRKECAILDAKIERPLSLKGLTSRRRTTSPG